MEFNMRRLFIIRKDLHLTPGKLSAMIGHLCEAFWTNLLKAGSIKDNEFEELRVVETYPDGKKGPMLYRHPALYEAAKKAFEEGKEWFLHKLENSRPTMSISIEIPKDIWHEYVQGIFTKTICEAKNKNQLMKVIELINEHNNQVIHEDEMLIKDIDYGFINDKCLTELTPENEDGTTTIGIWFKPLPDDIAHKFSKKYKLYRD